MIIDSCSKLRISTLLPFAGFIDYVVQPAFRICGDMMKFMVENQSKRTSALARLGSVQSDSGINPAKDVVHHVNIWKHFIADNLERWKQSMSRECGMISVFEVCDDDDDDIAGKVAEGYEEPGLSEAAE